MRSQKNDSHDQAPAISGGESGTAGSVTSEDGTIIGYRRFGRGPGLVVLHGAMSSAHNHVQLAEALADTFTVYVPDRRGRGRSGPHRAGHSLRHEVEDLAALLAGTGAHDVLGVSSGGIIALHAALTVPAIRRIAVYEPPLFLAAAEPTAILTRFDREMERGRTAAALVVGMKGARMGPAVFGAIPTRLLEPLVRMAMAQEEKKGTGDYVPMRELAPTLHADFQIVAEVGGRMADFAAVRAETLLLGGSRSPAYLKTALVALEKVLPNVQRVEFPGLGHAASWNSDRGGRPEPVARELRRFFSRPFS